MSACPTCTTHPLVPVQLAGAGLPALGCHGCGGALLSLVSYRDWRDGEGAPAVASAVGPATAPVASPVDAPAADAAASPAIDAIGDSHNALRCPKCTRLMTKYRFSADTRNQIDLCDHCDEVWLDGGEWELLGSLSLSARLAAIFTQPWQHRLRSEEARRRAEARWRDTLGDDYARAHELRGWLARHPKGRELLAYLYLSQTEPPAVARH